MQLICWVCPVSLNETLYCLCTELDPVNFILFLDGNLNIQQLQHLLIQQQRQQLAAAAAAQQQQAVQQVCSKLLFLKSPYPNRLKTSLASIEI